MARTKLFLLSLLVSVGFLTVQGQKKDLPGKGTDSALRKVDSLKAAIVTATIRPRMKGDTVEYNVGNLLLQRNAVIEDLLRRLPGLHIEPDGTITYNGEKIEHLLVDGEDIFGNDPTMVTRNFDASKIARVQILDRKSDNAIFTGVDDGTRTKTLNLVLKESAKDGYFGRIEAGANTGGNYNANSAVAAFKNKEQFTALGIAANTGVVGFSNSSGAAVTFLNANADALGASAGIGIPRFDAAALHYANTWPGLTNHLTGNYQYSHFYTQPISSTESLEIQPGTIYGQTQQMQSTNEQDQHWLYGIYDWAPDARSAIKITFHFSHSDGGNQFASSGKSSFNDTLVNSNLRIIHDKVIRRTIGGSLSWRIQVGKRTDRVFSVNGSATKLDINTNGYLYSLVQFYQPGSIQSNDTVDQRKQISGHSLNLGGSINYTEPLWRGTVLAMSYGISRTGDDPLQATFDRGDGKYQTRIDSLSTYFKTQTVSQRGTLNFQGKTGQFSYTLGGDWLGYSYGQQDLITDSNLRVHYSNWATRLMMNYYMNKATYLHVEYSASTSEPTIAQLTPTPNNTDPLHITLGNPNLKPGYIQNLKVDFHHFKTWLVDLVLMGSVISNSISTRTVTDSLGRQISRPVNVNGGRTSGVNLTISRNVLGFNAGLHLYGTYTQSGNYINADLNRNTAYMGGGGLSLNRYLIDMFSLEFHSNISYFDQVSSVNTSVSWPYWMQTHSGAISLYFIKDVEVNTNAVYTWQEKTSAFGANTSVMLWNAFISRNFIGGKLVVKFLLNNILDANAGIVRVTVLNTYTQTASNIMGRYWMVSATWHFDKKFGRK